MVICRTKGDKMKIRKYKNFVSCFNERTGEYFRTGIIKNGVDTGTDPFMAPFPELLDVGIMGHCIHEKRGLCMAAGVECYQNGMYSNLQNMSLANFEKIAKQCGGKVYQFALGGCGDPDQHEDFKNILKICREYEITPNFTTSGLGMTKELAQLCKEYCGAVAVSWYGGDYTVNAIELLIKAGVKTNIHYVLHNESIKEAMYRMKEGKFPKGINAVIFLLHKPVGLGTREKVISVNNEEYIQFIKYISEEKLEYKVGFDSCTVPAFANHPGKIDTDSLDTCEGARWSAYITPDMKMLPCSFDNQEQRWAVDLNVYTIQEAWDSAEFDQFREKFRNACPGCEKRNLCMGGCPIRPEIVLCSNKQSFEQDILITKDMNEKRLVVIPHVLFKGKRNVPWKEVEKYLIRYVGKIFEVAETEDFICIDKIFSDEYTGSVYTRKLKGALPKVKANMSQGIPQMIEIATEKRWKEDFENKHKKKAGNGWFRYSTRFALPVMNEKGDILDYNVYQAVLIVRYAADKKMYLYDIQNIKKETRYPSWTE